MNILIVKLSAIGDVIHTLPALNAVRRHFPNSNITWITEEAAYPLIKGHEAIDRIIVSKRKRWLRQLKGPERKDALKAINEFIRQLRDTRYDIVIDFQQLLKSAVLVALSKAKRKIGFDKGMEHMEQSHIFSNERIAPVSMEIHALSRYLMLIEAAGIPCHEIEYKLPVSHSDKKAVSDLLFDFSISHNKPLVAINPMAKWDTKLWQNEKFAETADHLIQKDKVSVVFTGGPEDRDAIDDILSKMSVSGAVNLAGKTSLMMLAALYKRCDLLITTDTGPMHMAAATNTPVIALFGSTAPWRTGPFGNGHQIVRTGIKCSPCFKRQCSHNSCMKNIMVQNVLEKILKSGIIQHDDLDVAG